VSKWAVLGFVSAALIGALAFLRVTANEIALVNKIIHRKIEEIERKRRQKQQAEAQAEPDAGNDDTKNQVQPVDTDRPAADTDNATIS